MSHDRQAIIVFRMGAKKLDAISIEAAKNLAVKWGVHDRRAGLKVRPHYIARRYRQHIERFDKKTSDELAALGKDSRLYVIGHGNWAKGTCCGLTGKQVADYLALHKLGPTVGLISVVACGGAAGGSAVDGPDYASLNNSAWSFTGQLHISLGIDHHIKTTCHGRAGDVTVREKTSPLDHRYVVTEIGRKGTRMLGPTGEPTGPTGAMTLSRRTESKICFYWDGKIQRQRWIDYGKVSDLYSLSIALGLNDRPTV